MVAGLNSVNKLLGKDKIIFSEETIIGALAKYISTENKNFQPMNANFGILNIEEKFKDKKKKYEVLAERSLKHFENRSEEN